jgi:hypothetical protein
VSYARHPSEAVAGWEIAFGIMGEHLRPVGPWITNHEASNFDIVPTAGAGWAIATLAAVAAGGLLARRRGERGASMLALVALIANALALFATARATGVIAPYVVRWWRGVAALAYFSIAWSLFVGHRSAWLRGAVTGGAIIAMTSTAAIALVEMPATLPLPSFSTAVRELSAPTADALDPDLRYLVQGVDRHSLQAATSGMFLALTERGFKVFTNRMPNAALTHGAWRLATRSEVDAVISVVAIPELDGGWRPPSGARVVASWDPLSPAQRVRVRTLAGRIRRATGTDASQEMVVDSPYLRSLAVKQGANERDVADLARLQHRGDGFVVFVSPAH